MEPNTHLPRKTRRVMWARHPARGDNGRVAKELENTRHKETATLIIGNDLTLFAIPVVVAMSDFIIKQDGDICCSGLGVLVFALKICNILLERSLVLF
jgi:hypothetical protein